MIEAKALPATTGAVLAGGESRRFGRPKWRARLYGATLLERSANAFGGWCAEVIVVGRKEARADTRALGSGARFVEDLPLGRGPLVGLATGLRAARTGLVAVVGCDMPFADGAMFRRLARLARGWDAVIPIAGGRAQPLHAIYHRRCLQPMLAALAEGVRAPTDFLRRQELRVRFVEAEELGAPSSRLPPFVSIDTPEDLRRARHRLRRFERQDA